MHMSLRERVCDKWLRRKEGIYRRTAHSEGGGCQGRARECVFLCACTQLGVFPHSRFDPGVMCMSEWAHVSAAAHGCSSLMRRAAPRGGSHLMRAVEMVKHTAGLHVISVSLALDMDQFQTRPRNANTCWQQYLLITDGAKHTIRA